jgi:hypothetical protein
VTISVLQHASTTKSLTSGTTGTASPAFSSALTAGSAVVACVTVLGSLATPTISSVTTNGTAELWVHGISGTAETAAGDQTDQIWVNPNTGGGQTIIDINCSFSATLSSSDNAVILVDI